MKKLSVIIITLNEEKNISRCLNSVKWADELIVVDSGSTDRTCEIAEQEFDARVFKQGWPGDGPQKRFGIEQATNAWCLILDADEELSEALSISMQQALQSDTPSFYKIHRRSYFLGKILKHGDWGRDWIVRLFDKTKHEYTDAIAHSRLDVRKSDAAVLGGFLIHHSQEDVFLSVKKLNDYSTLSAEMMAEKGKGSSVFSAISRGYFAFFRSYFMRLGFLDGIHGYLCARNIGLGAYLKHIKRVYDIPAKR